MTDAGVAYVQLVPSMRGFSNDASKQLSDGLRGPATKAGEETGKGIGEGASKGIDGSSGRFKSAAGKLGTVFKTALAGAGLAAGLALTAGISGALENQQIEDKFVASMGGSEFARELGDIAGNLYTDAFGESLADTADAVKKVWQGGLLPEDATNAQIEALTGKILTFSDVMAQDMDMTTQAVQSMLKSGIVDSADEALDVMTRGIQQGADKAGDLAETFQEYGTSFRESGLSAADAAGLMSQGLANGARDADKVADALKEFGVLAQDGSAKAAAGYEAIGLNAAEMTAAVARGGPEARQALDTVLDGLRSMEDPFARNAAATALFGTQAEDLGDALFSLDLDTAAMMLGDTEGATEKLGEAYENAGTRIESFKRGAMMALTNFIGDRVIPIIGKLAGWLGPKLTAVFDAVGPPVREFIDALSTMVYAFQAGESFGGGGWYDVLGELGAGARDAVDAIGSMWTQVQPLFDYLSENGELVRGALLGIGTVILAVVVPALASMVIGMVAAAAPIIAVVAAAAALGAGLVWLYQNVEQVRTVVDAVLPALGELFRSTLDLIVVLIQRAVDVGLWVWNNFGDLILEGARIVWNLIAGIIQGALDIVTGIIRLVTAILRGDWSAAWEAVKQITSGAVTILKTLFRALLDGIQLALRVGWRIIETIFTTALSAIKGFVKGRIDDIVDFFQKLPGRLSSAISTLASTITRPFTSAFNSIKSLWNRTVGGFSFGVPDWIPGVGGKSFSIPKMHTGGRFRAPFGQREGLALLMDGERVLTPNQDTQAGFDVAASTPAPADPVVLKFMPGSSHLFKAWIQALVRTDGRGSVQEAFGQGAA